MGVFPRRMITTRRSISSKTFYDSQSGGYITVGGSAALHDTTFASGLWDNDQLLKLLSIKPSSIEFSSLKQLEEIRIMDEELPPLYISVDSLDNVEKLSSHEVDGIVVNLSSSGLNRFDLVDMVGEADSMGFSIRATVNCDLSINGTASAIATGAIVGDLADAGASVIMLKNESDGEHDEDTVREVLEECLYLDCSGDPIKQRLGLYVLSPEGDGEDALKVACELGCLHFVTTTANQDKVLSLLKK